MLAVLKAGAAFVPLDPGFPADRIGYIVSDAAASAVLTLGHLRGHLDEMQADGRVRRRPRRADRAALPSTRSPRPNGARPRDPLAYIIYTSGSTGRPKGVAVEHGEHRAASCGWPPRCTASGAGDRMYQGMTIAFDFSVEEIWVPWAAGATLVPKPAGAALLGPDLHEYLVTQRVTAMCCVPTLLSTIEEDLPELRFLLVSGEACPHDLIVRWHRPGTAVPQRLRAHRGHGDRDLDAGRPRPRGDHRRARCPPTRSSSSTPTTRTAPCPAGGSASSGIAGIGLAAGTSTAPT